MTERTFRAIKYFLAGIIFTLVLYISMQIFFPHSLPSYRRGFDDGLLYSHRDSVEYVVYTEGENVYIEIRRKQ